MYTAHYSCHCTVACMSDQQPTNDLLQGSSDSPYAEHGWNLNNLPKLDGTYGSMLRHIEEIIPGVVVPWMYIGMMFSSFCWHIEDHMFYSINYHHWGDAKKWYGVPGSAGHLFEEAFRKALPGHFERQPDLLFHLTTLLSPRILHQYDVPVYSATQHEGEFVITFPNAYHGGFNMGFNCAEAVNFAPADWFRFGSAGTERFRTFRKPSVVSHEGLLLKVGRVLCCPLLCCAVLCCAVLCCAVLCNFLATYINEQCTMLLL